MGILFTCFHNSAPCVVCEFRILSEQPRIHFADLLDKMLEHTLPKGSSDFRVGASMHLFFLSSISKTFLAEALDPDKRITADDDWHLEQCKAKEEEKVR